MSETRPLRILAVHPGATWSVADVFDGLLYGLRQHGVYVVPYRLDTRIAASKLWCRHLWKTKRKEDPTLAKPTQADEIYHAGIGILEMALREQVDVVLAVSAFLLHPDLILMLKRVVKVTVLFTESPYDEASELKVARLVDGCWTNERTCVEKFQAVNPNSGYLPHGWHPLKHYVGTRALTEVPTHDVVFVGSGFNERITWFNEIDWSGIDLGLYGTWADRGLKPQVEACIRSEVIANEAASALYRRARIGLNLYRNRRSACNTTKPNVHAESLSPRAYELAACGAFSISDYRAEVPEVFGDLVPTFRTSAEASDLIRRWLADPEGRAAKAAALPKAVESASWTERAATVLGDLSRLFQQRAA